VFPQARSPTVSALDAKTREGAFPLNVSLVSFDHLLARYLSTEAVQDTGRYLEEKGVSHLFPENSWQRKMVADCRTMFSVKPRKGDAILFYSQHPNGEVDKMSIHGGCPVISGTKWAANLWVWNGPRNGYMVRDEVTGNMRRKLPEERAAEASSVADDNSQTEKKVDISRSVTFVNVDVTTEANLYWEDQFWSKMEIGRTISVNTFLGHRWYVNVNGQRMLWTIDSDSGSQKFELKKDDLLY